MPRGKHDGLAARACAREPFPRRAARVDDRTGTDLDGSVPGVTIDRGAGGVLHEPEHEVERHPLLESFEPELLVGIMLQEHLDVPADVLDGVGRGAGDTAGQECPLEVRPVDGAGDPVVFREGRQTADVGFDNVGRHWVSA